MVKSKNKETSIELLEKKCVYIFLIWMPYMFILPSFFVENISNNKNFC